MTGLRSAYRGKAYLGLDGSARSAVRRVLSVGYGSANRSHLWATEEPVTLAYFIFVRARLEAGGYWTFDVAVQHEDTGGEHYADLSEVLTLGGEVLATRVLTHPHVDEQPFTRSQGGIVIPEGGTQVRVRAHDLVHGYGGREMVDLTQAEGEDFELER